jgi:catechol 2,3-dioxygenase-like lactoylglutathione lyase family enzyme
VATIFLFFVGYVYATILYMKIAHIGFTVSDIQKTREMYVKALSPIGLSIQMEGDGYVGFGADDSNLLWLGELNEKHSVIAKDIHVAFLADKQEDVDAFYRAGLEAGFIDNGAPGIRDHYAPNYYAAFLLNNDGNNIEVVHFIP